MLNCLYFFEDLKTKQKKNHSNKWIEGKSGDWFCMTVSVSAWVFSFSRVHFHSSLLLLHHERVGRKDKMYYFCLKKLFCFGHFKCLFILGLQWGIKRVFVSASFTSFFKIKSISFSLLYIFYLFLSLCLV